MSVRMLVTIVAITSMPGMSFAQSSTSRALSGAGTASCGEYIERSANKLTADLFVTWAQGFLSALNVDRAAANHDPAATNQGFLLLPDGASIKAYLDKYCRDNPLESPLKGTMQLFRELQAREK